MTTFKKYTDYSIITYARVNSKWKKNELHQQTLLLNTLYPNAEHIEEYASGMDYNRVGFYYIIQKIEQKQIKQIIALSDDILLEFKFKQFKQFCIDHDCKIIIHNTKNNFIKSSQLYTKYWNRYLIF